MPLAKFIEKKCNGSKSATEQQAAAAAPAFKLKIESEFDEDDNDDAAAAFMDMSDDQLDDEDESKKYRWCVCDKGSLALFTTKTCDKCNSWYHLDCFEKPEESKLSDRDLRNRDFVCFVCKGDKKLIEKYARQLETRKKNNQTASYSANNATSSSSSEEEEEETAAAKAAVSKKRPVEEPAKKASKSFKKVSYSSSSGSGAGSSSENEGKEKQPKKKKKPTEGAHEPKSDKKRIEELKSRIKPPNQTKPMSGNDLTFKLGRITTNKPGSSKAAFGDASSRYFI